MTVGPAPRCEACGVAMPRNGKWRMDDDGFVGCLPCFPVSNRPEDKDRFMRGPCYGKQKGAI